MHSVVILDLDGTVLSVNSFRLWVVHMLRARFPHLSAVRRLGIALAAGRLLVMRKAGLMGHETLKWQLQQLWRRAVAGESTAEAALIDRLLSFVRPELSPVLAAVADGRMDGVLATAAVADYAHGFARALALPHVLATPCERPAGTPSNVGPHKRDAVLGFLADRGWLERPLILFTDHKEDLPLIRVCGTVYWFGAEAERRALSVRLPGSILRPGHLASEILTTPSN